ncbi:MAG: hypothetical protein Q4P33_07885, partial [Flaviflexus sp.]|nr:hypothetical protein [Flaviflexus sp.]
MDHTHDQSPQSNDPADKAHNTPPRSRFGFPKSGGDEDRQAVNAGETKPEEKSKKKIISILATIALFIFGAICAN